ncbi:hypothetical protein [Aeromicrobium sp. UC242_57]|uniref:hypothetical protein n=1 Tax=Aeromicrobium sp. UC242_57 TaxID=3374624 RepID=UPI00379C604B
MHFAFDDVTNELIERVTAFMDAEVYPAEPILKQQIEQSIAEDRWTFRPSSWSCARRRRRRDSGTSSTRASTAQG